MGLQTCKPDVPTAKEVREKLEARIAELEAKVAKLTEAAIRYDEAVGRLCPRAELVDYHDALLLAMEGVK